MSEWLKVNEHIWLFWQLNTEIVLGCFTLFILVKEYYYDYEKDEAKKQKRTKTSKKITETKDGGKVVEETTETSEPMKEDANGQQ